MDSFEATNMLTNHLIGASNSVHISCDGSSGWSFPLTLQEVTTLCDARLDLRYLIRSRQEHAESSDAHIRSIVGNTWQVRGTSRDPATANCIIIDREVLYAIVIDPPDEPDELFFVDDPVKVRRITWMFDNLWKAAVEIGSLIPLHEDLVRPSIELFEHKLVVSSKKFWDAIIRSLAARPELMHKLTSRKFEELIAELLSREGLDVNLTGATRDGGRDILAKSSLFKNHLYLVECKKHVPENPVGVTIVRELYGVLIQERATAAMIVTTSSFTKPALDFRKPIEFQMDLKDFEDLRKWIQRKAY